MPLSEWQLVDNSNGVATFQNSITGEQWQAPSGHGGVSEGFINQNFPPPQMTPASTPQEAPVVAPQQPEKVGFWQGMFPSKPLTPEQRAQWSNDITAPASEAVSNFFPAHRDPVTGQPIQKPSVALPAEVPNPAEKDTSRFTKSDITQPLSGAKGSSPTSLIDQGYANRISATKNLGAIQSAGLSAQAKETDEAMKAVDQMNAKMAEDQNTHNFIVNDWMNRQSEAKKQIDNTKIDPGRKFKSLGTWGTIGAAIAVAANAVGNALLGRTDGKNESVDIILKAIDDDIGLQEKDIDKKKGDLNTDMNMLSRYMGAFGDRTTAKRQLRADYIDQVNMRLSAMDKRVKSEEAKYGIQNAIGDLQIHQQKDRDESQKNWVETQVALAKNNKPANPMIASLLEAEKGLEDLYQKGIKQPHFAALGSTHQLWDRLADQWSTSYAKAMGMRISPQIIKSIRSQRFPSKFTYGEASDALRLNRRKAVEQTIASSPENTQEPELPSTEGF